MKIKIFVKNTLLVMISCLAAFLIMELIVRDYRYGWGNRILQEGNFYQHHTSGINHYDSRLGWVPFENKVVSKWNTEVTLTADGIRSNGIPGVVNPKGVILTVGGSFTFGDQVGDSQTWPALLERLSGHRVLNAGVPSYGLDQSILRADNLIKIYQPDILVVSLILDSIKRSRQYIRHGVPMPYFLRTERSFSPASTTCPQSLEHPSGSLAGWDTAGFSCG